MGASGLGSLLVKEGLLTEQDRLTINRTCGQGSWAFAKSVLTMGLLDEEELAAFVAERTKYRVTAKNFLQKLDLGMSQRVDGRMFSRLEILPLSLEGKKLTVAVADPLDKATLAQLEFFTGYEILPLIAPLSQIYEGLIRLNPEFKPRLSALSNFLRNHAAGAWVKQKVSDDIDQDGAPGNFEKGRRKDKKKASIDPELFAATRSNLSEDPFDIDGPEDSFGSSHAADADDDLDFELDGAEGGDNDAGSMLDASEGLSADVSETETGDSWEDGFDFDEAPKAVASGASEISGRDELNDLDLDGTLEADDLDNLDAFDSMSIDHAQPSTAASLPEETISDLGASEAGSGLDGEDDPFASLENDDGGFDLDDPLDAFSDEIEQTDQLIESAPQNFEDLEPEIESSPVQTDRSPLPSELLLASLDADQSELIDDLDPEQPSAATEGEEFELETRSGIAILEESLTAADSDLIDDPELDLDSGEGLSGQLEEKSTNEEPLSSVPRTALVNELLLRLSLCFDRDALFNLLNTSLIDLCPSGCLMLSSDRGQNLIGWRDGEAISSEMSKKLERQLNEWAPSVEEASWNTIRLSPSLSWDGEFSALWTGTGPRGPACVWLGQHSLEDEAFTEVLQEFLGQLAARGVGQGLKVG